MLEVEKIDPKLFQSALKILKKTNENVTKDLRTKLSTALQPYATKLAFQMPEVSPLKGMTTGSGPYQYKRPVGKVSFTPGSGRKNKSVRAGEQTKLLAITLNSGSARGFYIMELAGTRSKGKTADGRIMIERLNQDAPLSGRSKRGGRYAWPEFVKIFGNVQKISEDIINKTLAELERKL